MPEKLLDAQGRHRKTTVSFRVSPEEAELLDRMVAASGLTKQDYITSCLLEHEITIIPNSRTYKGACTESCGASGKWETSARTWRTC